MRIGEKLSWRKRWARRCPGSSAPSAAGAGLYSESSGRAVNAAPLLSILGNLPQAVL